MTDVFELSAHERLAPEQALAVAARWDWREVIIFGTNEQSEIMVLSSRMSRERAFFLSEFFRIYILQNGDTHIPPPAKSQS